MTLLSDTGSNRVQSSNGKAGYEAHDPADIDSIHGPMGHLHISAQKLANIKSPMFMKLDAMIHTLDKFRGEMQGDRVPKFEAAFIEKRREEAHRQRK